MTLPNDFAYPDVIEDEHSEDRPLCWNPERRCPEDDLLIRHVYLFDLDGLLTAHEAAGFVAGKGI